MQKYCTKIWYWWWALITIKVAPRNHATTWPSFWSHQWQSLDSFSCKTFFLFLLLYHYHIFLVHNTAFCDDFLMLVCHKLWSLSPFHHLLYHHPRPQPLLVPCSSPIDFPFCFHSLKCREDISLSGSCFVSWHDTLQGMLSITYTWYNHFVLYELHFLCHSSVDGQCGSF